MTENEKNDENIFYCYFKGKNLAVNKNEIFVKIKNSKEKSVQIIIHIPVIFYLNNFIIISNSKDNQDITIKEYTEENEDLVSISFFELKLKIYLSKVQKLKQSKSKTINNSLNASEFINYVEKKSDFIPNKISKEIKPILNYMIYVNKV